MQDMLVQPWLLNIGGSAGYASTAMIIKVVQDMLSN